MKFFDLFRPKSYLGIDIGTSSIKTVQLSKSGGSFKLDTYGEIKFLSGDTPMEVSQQSVLKMLDAEVAELLKKIMAESGASATTTAMSLPVFSTFSTIIELPAMPRDEMEKAIQFEARQYVPIPLSEVSLDFMIIGEERKEHAATGAPEQGAAAQQNNAPSTHRKKHVEVLLVAVPNEIKKKYRDIAKLAGLDLVALEIETFPIARALLSDSRVTTVIVDIGARSTDICIVDNGFVRISHNFEFSGVDITKAYAEFTHVDFVAAEQKKKVIGLELTPGQLDGAKALTGIVDDIINETERIIASYYNKTGRMVSVVVLSGGGAKMPGLLAAFQAKMKQAVSVGDPFAHIAHAPELTNALADIGPSFAVAVGLAMRK